MPYLFKHGTQRTEVSIEGHFATIFRHGFKTKLDPAQLAASVHRLIIRERETEIPRPPGKLHPLPQTGRSAQGEAEIAVCKKAMPTSDFQPKIRPPGRKGEKHPLEADLFLR